MTNDSVKAHVESQLFLIGFEQSLHISTYYVYWYGVDGIIRVSVDYVDCKFEVWDELSKLKQPYTTKSIEKLMGHLALLLDKAKASEPLQTASILTEE